MTGRLMILASQTISDYHFSIIGPKLTGLAYI